MNDMQKTLGFVAAAAIALGAAFVTRPTPFRGESQVALDTEFFADFTDPLTAASLEVVKFDDATGEVKPFKVAQVNGVWSIPSKLDYPADAERQLSQAAASLIGLKRLSQVAESPGDHGLYGVLDPNKAQPGDEGVGMSVKMDDASGKNLCQFIVGKEVKDQAGLRYVRLPGKDVVYTAKIKTDKLSTSFADWIEKDLLKLNSFDLREIILDNYSIDETQGVVNPGERMFLKYNEKDSKWSLEGLAEEEEMVTDKLNDLKNALDDLKIVDVQRKPAGLANDLRLSEGIQIDQQAFFALQRRGFFVVKGQLLSNEGDVVCRTKDGVEYMLRFGEIAVGTEEEKKEDAAEGEAKAEGGEAGADAEKKPADDKPKDGANRYVFVTARLDLDMIPKPELEAMPGEAPAAGPAAAEGQPATEAPPDAETPAAEKPATEKPATEQPAADAPAAPPGGGGDDAGAVAQAEAAAAPAAADAAAGEEGKGEEIKNTAPTADEVERARIEKENKRKQDEYDKKVKDGQKKVDDLNARFADWFYVISDSVYKKIKVGRADLVKAKEKPAGEGDSLKDFDKLQEGPEAAPGP